MKLMRKCFPPVLVLFAVIFVFTARGEIDSSKYITVDEVKTSMPAYCLTAYKGSKIEKFPLKVLSVVYDIEPGHNAIMVQGTDERFKHTGPVAGCSGSPVYIDGRLAGALAFGWSYSKDPLYGVTPIEEMLQVGQAALDTDVPVGYSFDFTKPIDITEITRQIQTANISASRNTGIKPLACPVSVSGLSEKGLEYFNRDFADTGLFAVSGAAKSKTDKSESNITLQPGAVLSVPLVSGDVSLAATGTVTEVAENKVYGFGHSFFGYGGVDFPMATGKVHTVVSSVVRSFKLASPLDTVGSLKMDQATAVVGYMGEYAKQVPLIITVDRYNDPEGVKKYECEMACNKILSPKLLASVIAGTVTKQGSLYPDGSIEYDVDIKFERLLPIHFSNVAAESDMRILIGQAMSSLGLVMNNPYRKANLESVNVNVKVSKEDMRGHIWSSSLSKTEAKPGENINITTILEKARGGKKEYTAYFKIPRQLKKGSYKIIVCGANYYESFLAKKAPQKLSADNLESLIEALNYSLNIETDRLYCMFLLPPEGIAIERAELPELPGTKALVLADSRRSLKIRPYNKWLEKNIKTDMVVQGHQVLDVSVKK